MCLDARLLSGESGGVEQVIIGLASGLSQLDDGDEEYFFLAYEDSTEWLRPFLGGASRLLRDGRARAGQNPRFSTWKRRMGPLAPFARHARDNWIPLAMRPKTAVPTSSGLIERERIDVMHFTKQDGFLTSVPSIYHPHDLQHHHLPQFFSQRERSAREVIYRTLCAQAEMVAVGTCWVKEDLVLRYGLPASKVQVVRLAPPTDAYHEACAEDIRDTRAKFALPEAFLFYPAQTWPHKNHLMLLKALCVLRDRFGLEIPLVCSGRLTRDFGQIKRFAAMRHLNRHVTFLDFVSTLELQCLYKMCRGVVFPSRFEEIGFPVIEAFRFGTPVACSDLTPLVEQAKDAVLFFDPTDPDAIAEAMRRLWTDGALRETLVARGARRVKDYGWRDAARVFRAHYRQVARRDLSEEDRYLLAVDPCP